MVTFALLSRCTLTAASRPSRALSSALVRLDDVPCSLLSETRLLRRGGVAAGGAAGGGSASSEVWVEARPACWPAERNEERDGRFFSCVVVLEALSPVPLLRLARKFDRRGRRSSEVAPDARGTLERIWRCGEPWSSLFITFSSLTVPSPWTAD